MPLRVQCQCGETLTMPDNKAGMEVICPLCDQLITIPSGREVVPPPPPPPAAAPVPAPPKQTPPTLPSNRQSSSRVEPPPLDKSDGDLGAGSRTAADKLSKLDLPAVTPLKKLPVTPDESSVAQSPAREGKDRRASPKPIPTPRRLKEQQVAGPTKPPGPPPRKKSNSEAGESKSATTAASTDVMSGTANSPPTPVPPPLKRDGRTADTKPTSQSPPAPPPTMASSDTPNVVSVQAPPAQTDKSTPPGTPSHELEPEEKIRGIEHDPGKKWTVYQLGCCLAVLALIGMIPCILEVVRHVTDFDSRGVENWAYFVFLVSGIQLAYALYMVQLPDWSTARVVMVVSAILSVLYATSMGVALMAADDNAIIAALGLTAQHAAGYVSLWCCMMTLLMSLLTYFLVRTSMRWQRIYELATAGR